MTAKWIKKMINKHSVIINSIIFTFFLILFIILIHGYYYHQNRLCTLIEKASAQYPISQNPGDIDFTPNETFMKSDIDIIKKEQASLIRLLLQTLYIYLVPSFLILLISFVISVGAAYNPYSIIAKPFKWIIDLIDSIPQIFWIILTIIIVFQVYSDAYWGKKLSIWYYPAVSFSYGIVLVVIFAQQNMRIIEEIRLQNIIFGEIVTGVRTYVIIYRMFRYQFAGSIMIRQFVYTILYLLLFDYSLMYIFEEYQQVSSGITPLTLKAGLYFLRFDAYNTLKMNTMAEMYHHLHDAAFFLILCLALFCFFILFLWFDRKDIAND